MELVIELAIRITGTRLRLDPVHGRQTFFAAITIGKRTFWLQRWDAARCVKEKPFAYSRDGLMCWTRGQH